MIDRILSLSRRSFREFQIQPRSLSHIRQRDVRGVVLDLVCLAEVEGPLDVETATRQLALVPSFSIPVQGFLPLPRHAETGKGSRSPLPTTPRTRKNQTCERTHHRTFGSLLVCFFVCSSWIIPMTRIPSFHLLLHNNNNKPQVRHHHINIGRQLRNNSSSMQHSNRESIQQ